MKSLAVEPEGDGETVYGVRVSELQSGITIKDSKISGTLLYKKGYTGFDSKNGDGNFLALKVNYPDDAEVKTSVIGGTTKDKKLPAHDHLLVTKVANNKQKIKLEITQGKYSDWVIYDLSGLTLNPAT